MTDSTSSILRTSCSTAKDCSGLLTQPFSQTHRRCPSTEMLVSEKRPSARMAFLTLGMIFLVVQIGIGKAAAPGMKTTGSAFRPPVRLLTPTSSYTLKGSLGCTATSWQDAVLALAGLDRNASTLDAQQGELP